MNIALTCATELPRRAFTVHDIRRMIDAGVLREDENFELIEGDIVMMAAKKVTHEQIKHALTHALVRAAPEDVFVGIESSLQLSETILVEPDITVLSRDVYRRADPQSFAQPRAADVSLLIEIAVSRMKYDREVKARLYARHGIREFWVIDAERRITYVHTGPEGEGWSSIVEKGPEETLTAAALPGFSVRLCDI